MRLEELREVAVREGWTHECKVWALGRFALDEHDVDEGKVVSEFWSYLRFS